MKLTQQMTIVLSAGVLALSALAAQAQSSLQYLGQAVGGQSVNLDLNSISRASNRSVDFTYYLGNDERESQANCENGTWTTFRDGVVHSPESATTAEMVRLVCGGGYNNAPRTTNEGSRGQSWFVFDPPSNVRTSPNGALLCIIRSTEDINIYGWDGDWAITDVCGVHSQQSA
jgi:hypothetical protein